MGIWSENDVVLTSMRRDDVASTLIRHHCGTKCPLGWIRIPMGETVKVRQIPQSEKKALFSALQTRWPPLVNYMHVLLIVDALFPGPNPGTH